MLACSRIGAIHSVVFGGFASEELGRRIQHAEVFYDLLISKAAKDVNPAGCSIYCSTTFGTLFWNDMNTSVLECLVYYCMRATTHYYIY
jgi:hypothetical protein